MSGRVLFVANEALEPALNGGRRRMVALVGALSHQFEVTVVAPGPPSAGRHQGRAARLGSTVRMRPRLSSLLDGDVRRRYEVASARPGVAFTFVSHSYLVPALPGTGGPLVVDFPNIEQDRQRSVAGQRKGPRRAVARVEALKAAYWEPAVARRATLCLCISDADAVVVRAWGGTAVVAPNSAERCCAYHASPRNGFALFLGDLRYQPNRKAADRLLRSVWPRILAARPQSRLVLAGRGSEALRVPADLVASVDCLGYVASVHDCYAGAALVVNLVDSGGGSQLKMAEAFAHGRAVVTTPYGAAQVDPLPRRQLETAGDADAQAAAVVRLLDGEDLRRSHERRLFDLATSWDDQLRPAMDALSARLSSQVRG